MTDTILRLTVQPGRRSILPITRFQLEISLEIFTMYSVLVDVLAGGDEKIALAESRIGMDNLFQASKLNVRYVWPLRCLV